MDEPFFLYFNLLKFQKPPIFRWNWASLTFQSIYALDADHLLIILNRLLSLSHEQTASNFRIISILKSQIKLYPMGWPGIKLRGLTNALNVWGISYLLPDVDRTVTQLYWDY